MLYAAGGSFGVLSRAQGAAERVRNRDNPPPQPRPVEAHLQAAMRSPLGAPGARWNGERAPMWGGGGLACSTPSAIGPDRCTHRGVACTRSEPRALGAKCSVTLAREGDTMGNPRFLCTRSPNGRGLAPIGTIQHQFKSYFLLGPVGTLAKVRGHTRWRARQPGLTRATRGTVYPRLPRGRIAALTRCRASSSARG